MNKPEIDELKEKFPKQKPKKHDPREIPRAMLELIRVMRSQNFKDDQILGVVEAGLKNFAGENP